MRIITIICFCFCVLTPALAIAQAPRRVSVQAAAGPTLVDEGYNVSVAAGYSPNSRVTLQLNAERMHVFTRTTSDGRGTTTRFRGGKVATVSGELRVSLLPADRFTPYAFVGTGLGTSQPNVNDTFPDPVDRHTVRVFFAGGGIQAPIGSRVSLFADARMMLGVGTDSHEFIGAVPVRAGIAVRF